MSTGTDLGFDLDEETIETFDAILLACTQDPELKEELKDAEKHIDELYEDIYWRTNH